MNGDRPPIEQVVITRADGMKLGFVVDHVLGGLHTDQREALHALGRQIVSQLELRRGMGEVGQTGGDGDLSSSNTHKKVVNLEKRPLQQRASTREEPPAGKPVAAVPQIVWAAVGRQLIATQPSGLIFLISTRSR